MSRTLSHTAPPLTRRTALTAGAAALATLIHSPLKARPMTRTFDPVPPLPAQPTPGKPGDFDFLAGEWRIQHLWRSGPDGEWIEFAGEATCWTILGGVASVEELRIPARDFHGMGLRLLDVSQRVWSDHWVNARSGVLARDGQRGSFENGVGIFIGDDVLDGRPIKAGGLWDQITPTSCRWRQVVSRDGGKTWEHTWVMQWRRAG
jgi:hypothetical protein